MLRKLILLAALLPMLLVQNAAALQDPFRDVAKSAGKYAKALAQRPGGYAAGGDRRTLQSAADLLADGTRCTVAIEISKLLVTGIADPKFGDWMRLAENAACAKRWDDAVSAAYLASENAPQPGDRQRALVALGQALEAHWRYGIGPALEAYRRAAGLGKFPGLNERIAELDARWAEMLALRVERIYAETGTGSPSICIDFTEQVPTPDVQRYGDYIRFEPALQGGFRREADDEICVEGPEFGASYQVVVLAGLSAESGNKITQAVNQEVEVGDRPPTLWFENRLYVLPSGGGGVPIHAVNIDQAKLKLYRVGERNLPQDFLRENFLTDIDREEAERIRDRFGELIWEGSAELAPRPNQEVVTSLPVAPLAAPAPGVYVLTAEPASDKDDEEEPWEKATQWLVVSDIGLTSYQGVEGMTVLARSLRTAQPLENVRLAIYARNNQLLEEVPTDGSGVAHFSAKSLGSPGGQMPDTLMAFGAGGDFNFLDLASTAFDLSDRGVAGRAVPGPLDAFLYTERGVYRPGETVRLSVLLRDDRGAAVDGLPLTLRLIRPDEQRAEERVIHPSGAGGYVADFPVSGSARLGRWKLLAYIDPKAKPVGDTAFLVEAILPPRIEVKLSAEPEAPLRPDEESSFEIEARYLFGAAGADLTAGAEVRVAADPDPFPAFPGYLFGLVDQEDDSVLTLLDPVTTDADGRARFQFALDRLPETQAAARRDLCRGARRRRTSGRHVF